jgi:hypothetical protein
MKRPTWATVVGILGIVFSCLGFLGAGQEIMMPKILKFQKEMFSHIEENIQKQSDEARERMSSENENRSNIDFPTEMFKFMGKMWEFPEWYGKWIVIFGVIKLFLCGLYLFASIRLLQIKPSAIRLFYLAAGLTIFLSLIKGIVSLSALSFIGFTMMFGVMFGVIIDIVLIIVVATGNKEAFSNTSPPPLPQNI